MQRTASENAAVTCTLLKNPGSPAFSCQSNIDSRKPENNTVALYNIFDKLSRNRHSLLIAQAIVSSPKLFFIVYVLSDRFGGDMSLLSLTMLLSNVKNCTFRTFSNVMKKGKCETTLE